MRVFVLCLVLLAQANAAVVPIILDTDMDSDCDDAAALAILHAFADRGEAKILGTMVSSKHPWSAACVDAINTFHGRPDLPIGVPKGKGAHEQGSKYARQISQEFPHDTPPVQQVPDATIQYRKILRSQPDRTVTIVTVGDLTNLRYLLESRPDEISPLPGRSLVMKKVNLWVCMGSRYPADLDPNKWGNFKPDAKSTYHAIQNWPTRIIFTGGGTFADSVAVGSRLRELPEKNPVRRSYELYFGGVTKDRHSADLISVMVAVRGPGAPWKLVRQGYNHIFPDGTHEWRDTPENALHDYISALDGHKEKIVVSEFHKLLLEGATGRIRGSTLPP